MLRLSFFKIIFKAIILKKVVVITCTFMQLLAIIEILGKQPALMLLYLLQQANQEALGYFFKIIF